ncbi:MAG: SDR family oxidoreductase [bacterium]
MRTRGPDEGRPAAFVTGGTRGLGLAAARALLDRGWDVWLAGRDPDRMEGALEALGAPPGRAGGTPVDVTDREALERAAEDFTSRFGRWDGLVCSAGTFHLSPLVEESLSAFRGSLEANLVGTFLPLRAALPSMYAAGSGHILAVGSVAAKEPLPENGAYSASKYGLRGLMEVLAEEAVPRGLTVSMIHPPAVDTPLWDELPEEKREEFDRSTFLDPGDVGRRIADILTDPPGPFNDVDLF